MSNAPMERLSLWIQREDPVLVGTAVGAFLCGLAGGTIGLLVGLSAYAPTAWAAVFEVGVPSSIVGGLMGAIVGAVMKFRRARRKSRSRR
jgi:hypothetical protein